MKWRIAINREGMNKTLWKPGIHSYICGDHFRAEDYQSYIDKSGRKHLEPDAVPSLFSYKPSFPKEASARSRRASRRWEQAISTNNLPSEVVAEEFVVETGPEADFLSTSKPSQAKESATIELDFPQTQTEIGRTTDMETEISLENELGADPGDAADSVDLADLNDSMDPADSADLAASADPAAPSDPAAAILSEDPFSVDIGDEIAMTNSDQFYISLGIVAEETFPELVSKEVQTVNICLLYYIET